MLIAPAPSPDKNSRSEYSLSDSTPVEKAVLVFSRYPVTTSWEELDRPGLRLPFYDPLDNEPAVLWRLSYFKPYHAPLASPSTDISLWQASMAAYTLSDLVPLRVKRPWTRVRFDQSSRRTQLLSVDHAQNFSLRAGLRGVYQRCTRTGEYLGQTTDHYSTGLLLYGETKADTFSHLRLYGFTQAFWNQLSDEINGGSVYDPAQGSAAAFQKESQPVRFVNGQWRTWYRLLRVEGGLSWGAHGREKFAGLQARVRQTYGGWRSGPARVSTSPFGADTNSVTTFAFGEEQHIGIRAGIAHNELSFHLVRWWGKGEDWQAFDRRAVSGEVRLVASRPGSSFSPELKLFYRHWISPSSPPPELNAYLYTRLPSPYNLSSALSLQYSRQALPWFFYQSYPVSRPRNPESFSGTYALLWHGFRRDTMQRFYPGAGRIQTGFFGLCFWGLGQRWPLLIREARAAQAGAALFWYGLRFVSDWSGKHLGLYSAVLLQRPLVPETLRWWTQQIPPLTGWIQIHYQWRIPPFTPVYRLGLRLRGSGAHQPPQYEPAYALFFAADDTPIQPSWAAIDVFLTLSLRQFDLYLRIDHAAEGLFQPGSFWTYPYPVPGRAFSFGFVWDVYN